MGRIGKKGWGKGLGTIGASNREEEYQTRLIEDATMFGRRIGGSML